MTNRKTREAAHNSGPIEEILREFREERSRIVDRLDRWPDDQVAATALHPRLKQPMRVIDMACFVAEHDDHHLAVITRLVKQFG